MKLRKRLAAVFLILLVIPFALVTILQIDRAMRVMIEGLDDSGKALINQVFAQMREVLSHSDGDPIVALRDDARLATFLRSSQAFGPGVVYARIDAADGKTIAGPPPASSRLDPPSSFAKLMAQMRSRWLPSIGAVCNGRTYEMSRTVEVNGRRLAVIRIGLSTAFIASEARRSASYILAVGVVGMALSLLGAIITAGLPREPIARPIGDAKQIADGRSELTPSVDGNGNPAALAERSNELSNKIRPNHPQWEIERNRYLDMLRSITDGVLLLDSAGSILFANSEAQGRMGLPAGGLAEGKRLSLLIGADNPLCRIIDTARTTGAEVRDVTIELGGGATANRVLVSVFMLGRGLGPPGMLVVARDLESIRQIERMIDYCGQLMRIGGLISGAANQVRAPIVSIKRQLERISGEAADGLPIKKKMATVCDEIERLDRTVEALLRCMRPAQLELAPVQLNPLLAETVRSILRPGIRLQYRLDREIGGIAVDRVLIAEAFRNILSNAVEAMPDGGRLTIATSRMPGGFVEIEITDEGSGIAPHNLQRAFDLFFTTKENGNGIGLTLALRAIEFHRGSIDIGPAAGTGTAVRIRLPVVQTLAAEHQTQ